MLSAAFAGLSAGGTIRSGKRNSFKVNDLHALTIWLDSHDANEFNHTYGINCET